MTVEYQSVADNVHRVHGSLTGGDTTFSVPAGYALLDIFVSETSGGVLAGTVRVGTSVAAQDVVAAVAYEGGSFIPCILLKRAFSISSPTTLHFTVGITLGDPDISWVAKITRAIP